VLNLRQGESRGMVDALARTATPQRPARASWTVGVAIGVTLLLWASAFVGIRAVGDTFSPGPMALLRLTVGSLALTVFVLVQGKGQVPTRPTGRGALLIACYGVLWFAGYTVVLNAAERHLDAGTAAMLVNVGPILVAVAAGRLLGEGFPRPLLAGIVVSFTGVTIIAVGGPGGHGDGLGVLLGLGTAVLYAAGILTQKVALRTTDSLTATWLGCITGTVVLLPFVPQAVDELTRAPGPAVAAVVYLGVFPTAVGFALWAYALTRINAGIMASTTLSVPGIVVLMSWALLGELPTAAGLVGGAMCLLGVAVSRRRPRSARVPRRAAFTVTDGRRGPGALRAPGR
jgi:drug/metabolite transporter (DMT)-like permease